jgi:hypothetical protein
MSYKAALGGVSLLVALIAYAPYLRDIMAHRTKPHALSWLVWASLSAVVFGIQTVGGGGYGAWLAGFNAALASAVFLLSLRYGERSMAMMDWLSLAAASGVLLLWLIVKSEIASVALASAVEAIGFMPTLRKSFNSPHEETATLYFLYALSAGLSLAALEGFSAVNAFYPVTLLVLNTSMAIFLWRRRRITGAVAPFAVVINKHSPATSNVITHAEFE